LICPRCSSLSTKVYGTRKGLVNIRFRECLECTYKFITKEILKEDLTSFEYNDYLEDIGEISKKDREKSKSIDTLF